MAGIRAPWLASATVADTSQAGWNGDRLMRDGEEPGRDYRSTRRAAPGARGCAGRRRPVLGLKEIRRVRRGVDRDRLRARHRRHCGDDGVLVRRILMNDGDVPVSARGDVDQLLAGIPAERVDAIAVGNGGDDLAVLRVDNH